MRIDDINGDGLDDWWCFDYAAQKVSINYNAGPSGGYFDDVSEGLTSTSAKIRAQWDSSVCLDVVGGNLTSNKNIEIWNCDGVTETWQITDPSDGRIRGTWPNGNNRCLDVAGDHSTTNGTNVGTYHCDGGGMETWVFDPNDHKIHAQWDYDVCLDVAGVNNTANGTNVQIWQCDQVSETWDIVEQ